MPRRINMATLVTRCKQRCDRENDSHISDEEWRSLISEAYASSVYSPVAKTGLRYFETSMTITADGSESYQEPVGHYSTVGVDRVVDAAGRICSLKELMAQERNQWRGVTGGFATKYELVDDRLFLYPRPQSGTYKWLYIQQPIDLTHYEDEDQVDVVTPDGETALIWAVAVLALAKSESDVSLALRQSEEAVKRLEEWAALRNIHQQRHRVNEDGGTDEDGSDWRFR